MVNETKRFASLTIAPVFKEDSTLDYMYDADGNVYNTFDELFETPYNFFFFYEYPVVYWNFELWYKKKGIKVEFKEGKYSGTPRKYDAVVPCILQGRSPDAAPHVLKTRYIKGGKSIYLFDLKAFLRSCNYFSITKESIKKADETMKIFTQEIAGEVRKRKGIPNSVASFARSKYGLTLGISNEDRYDYLTEIRSAYRGGLYWWKYEDKLKVYKKLYNYDVRSMYPAMLINRIYPNPNKVPVKKQGYVKIDNRYQLAMYHISELDIKLKEDKYIETIFTVIEEQNRLIKKGVSFFKGQIKTSQPLDNTEGWITSVDYDTLIRDYEVNSLLIDETYVIEDVKPGCIMFRCLQEDYAKKEQSEKGSYQREFYKLMIDSYSGSLGMMLNQEWKIKEISEYSKDRFLEKANAPSSIDVAAFMTAYSRQYISYLASFVPFEQMVALDTDGFWTTEPNKKIDMICGDQLGDIRLDKVMYDAVWYGVKQYSSREDSPTAPITPHISGLPGFLFKEGVDEYLVPQYVYNNSKSKYEYKEVKFTLIDKEVNDEEEFRAVCLESV